MNNINRGLWYGFEVILLVVKKVLLQIFYGLSCWGCYGDMVISVG